MYHKKKKINEIHINHKKKKNIWIGAYKYNKKKKGDKYSII